MYIQIFGAKYFVINKFLGYLPKILNIVKLVGKIEFNFCAKGIQVSAFGGGLWKKA